MASSLSAELFQKQAVWVTIPVLVMRPPYTKVAISLPDLIRQTNAFSVKRRGVSGHHPAPGTGHQGNAGRAAIPF